MKFQIEVGVKVGADVWWESFDKEEVTNEATARKWGEKTIQAFNASLRRGEVARRFVGGVRLISEGVKEHKWVKLNWGTKSDHRGSFDMMRCERCGCEGRRYGLGEGGVKRGATWKAKKWKHCHPSSKPQLDSNSTKEKP